MMEVEDFVFVCATKRESDFASSVEDLYCGKNRNILNDALLKIARSLSSLHEQRKIYQQVWNS
jgi:hypothetical protein